MVGSGNDFIVISSKPSGNLPGLAKILCDRKYGIGADGVLLLEKSKKADINMRIFNADGSEAQMCGNGARCAALFYGKAKSRISTAAGTINALVSGSKVKIQLTEPKNIKLDIPLMVSGRKIKVNFINTGVPHAVVFVDGIDGIDFRTQGFWIKIGRAGALECLELRLKVDRDVGIIVADQALCLAIPHARHGISTGEVRVGNQVCFG